MADGPAVNPAIIRRTQDLLGKYVKKPVLSEKLLRKPPFRFLHDVINVVIQDTGYLNGTYSPEELIYENVKEKDAKIAFLQKLIDAVKTTSAEGATLKARPSRIVAGHEPERTNELLQAIGIALDSNAGTASKPAAGPLKKRAPAAVADKVASKKTESNDAAKVRKPMAGSTTKPTRGDTETKRKPTDEKVSKKPIALKPSKTVTPMKVAKDDVIDKKSNKNADRNSGASSKKQARSEKTLDESGERQRKRTNTFIASDAKEVESNVGGEALADVEPIEPNSEIEVEVVQNDGASQVNEEVTQSSNFIEPAIIPMELENSSPSEEQQRSEIPIESVACDSISVAKLRKSSSKQRVAENPSAPIKIAESLDSSGKLLTLEAPQTANEKQIEIAESKLNVSPLDISNTQHVESKALNDASAVVSEVASMRKSSSKKQPADKPVNPSPSPTQSTQLAAPSVDKPTANAKPAATPAVPPPFPMLPSSRPRTSLRPASVRPASARPGAPRRRERNVQVYLPPDEATLAAAASTKLNAASGDAFGLDLDADDDQLIVVEDASMMGVGGHTADNAAGQTTAIGIGFSNGIDDTDGQQHGHLVQQILQTQKNFNENDNEQDFAVNNRQSSGKQMDTLRDSIQQMTRFVNPLGKLMDFLQEDVDAMQMELSVWRQSYATARTAMVRERSANESVVNPLQQQLLQIEATIREHVELTNVSRLNILQNEAKLHRLLAEI